MNVQEGKLALVKFAPRKGVENFFDDAKQAVESYFVRHGKSLNANTAMKVKTVVMLSLYVLPFIAIVTGLASFNIFFFLSMWLIMALGIVGIGTSVMHDSNHGAYSEKKGVNKWLGAVINLVGGYHVTWKIQHNVLHHTYTNIDGLDPDIDPGNILRFSPRSPWMKAHRFQHFYAWFFYGLLTIYWITTKDYNTLIAYDKIGLLRKEKITLKKALWQVSIIKVLYWSIMFVLPMIFAGVAWYWVLSGFILMHFVAGLSLSAIFQLAHVMEEAEFPLPSDDNKMENNWAIHQVLNTINFSPRSRILSWFIGGLNFQIEHHLFPHICHVHYPKISMLVRKVAARHNIPYQVERTFIGALANHTRMLKKLGAAE